MAEFSVPEILRVPLDSISLAVKATRETEDVKVSLRTQVGNRDSRAAFRCFCGKPLTHQRFLPWTAPGTP